MSDPDPTIPAVKPSSGGADSSPSDQVTKEFTDSQMQGALTPETCGSAGTVSRGWQPPAVEELQKMLPQYEVQQFLARGGMGAVYKGRQKSLDRIVAIKILPPGIEDDSEVHFAERFHQEARAMAKFKHPGIVTVYDAGETPDGLLYFIMEFIEGTDVAQLVSAHERLPVSQALAITTQVCDALAYAHGRGIVHRDIKPSNIMLETDGTVKVADFGLAKVVAQESAALTRSDMSLGTPDFIAPEAMLPGLKVDARADLYAVGVMLYQMLTGRIPRGRFRLPSGIVQELDPRLDAIVDKAMQPDREQRYASAAEMKADVECIVRDTSIGRNEVPTNATTPQAVATAGGNHRSLKKPLLIAAAAALALIVGASFVLKDRSGHAPPAATAAVSPATALQPAPTAGKVIDLLPLVNVQRDAIEGEWSRTSEGLAVKATASAKNGHARLQLPYDPPSEYDFEIEFTPLAGTGHVGQALSAGGRSSVWAMDSGVAIGKKAGFGSLDGKWIADYKEGTVLRQTILTNGRRHISRVEVRKGTLRGLLDGEKLVEWSGDFNRLAGGPMDAMRDARHLGLVFANRAATIHKITVREVSGAGAVGESSAIKLWDAPGKIPKEAGVRWENNAVVLGNSGNKGMLIYEASRSRDAIARADIRTNPDAESAQLRLRYRSTEGLGDFYRLQLNRGIVSLSTSVLGKGKEIGSWPLPRAYGPDEWARLELRAMGDELTVSLDGHVLGTVHDTSQPVPGAVMAVANANGWFRNIEYVPLDNGVPDHKAVVREIAGAGATETTPPSALSAWSAVDLKNQGWIADGDGFTTDLPIRGYSILASDTRDGAARLTYRLREASGVQITARGRLANGKFEKYVAEDELGALQIGRMAPDGSVSTLQKLPYPAGITREGEHTLELRIVGDTLTATLNGKLTATIKDSTLTEGSWALVLKKGALAKKLEVQTPQAK